MLQKIVNVSLLLNLLFSVQVAAFYAPPTVSRIPVTTLMQSASTSSESREVTSKGLLTRDRYVATNRFSVRKGKGPKFEKRWATRKSKLATLDGFKYFHLMRRVELGDDGTTTYLEGDSDESAFGNYVSFTIWNKKSDFSAWRKGSAFKEAHGGTSIGAFLSTMLNSVRVLRGAPRPAFYDGLLQQTMPPTNTPELVDGWRSVEADGVTNLPAECFVACNQFFVPPENAAAFEARWADRTSKLKECDGFVSFSMLRRDGQAKGHGVSPLDTDTEPTYSSTTIWRDRAAFDGWRNGQAFKQGHGEKKDDDSKVAQKPPAPLWSKPPQPVFYEGTLVITGEEGA